MALDLTITQTTLVKGVAPSGGKFAEYSVAADGTEYPLGGYTLVFTGEFTTVHGVHVAFESDNGTVQGKYDRTNNKLILTDVAEAGAQVTTSTDVSDLTFYLFATGEGPES